MLAELASMLLLLLPSRREGWWRWGTRHHQAREGSGLARRLEQCVRRDSPPMIPDDWFVVWKRDSRNVIGAALKEYVLDCLGAVSRRYERRQWRRECRAVDDAARYQLRHAARQGHFVIALMLAVLVYRLHGLGDRSDRGQRCLWSSEQPYNMREQLHHEPSLVQQERVGLLQCEQCRSGLVVDANAACQPWLEPFTSFVDKLLRDSREL